MHLWSTKIDGSSYNLHYKNLENKLEHHAIVNLKYQLAASSKSRRVPFRIDVLIIAKQKCFHYWFALTFHYLFFNRLHIFHIRFITANKKPNAIKLKFITVPERNAWLFIKLKRRRWSPCKMLPSRLYFIFEIFLKKWNINVTLNVDMQLTALIKLFSSYKASFSFCNLYFIFIAVN